MQLAGDYQAQAKLTVAGLDIGKPLAMFGPGTVKAQSLINGVATVSGPLKTPKALSGSAEFSQVDVKLQGIELKAAEPLRVGLRDGVATLDQVHITGQDTDMRASGTAQVFGVTDPKGVEQDQLRRRLARQLRDTRSRRVKAGLERIERETIADRNDQFAVE